VSLVRNGNVLTGGDDLCGLVVDVVEGAVEVAVLGVE
jgi:hypothetical protein